MFYLAKGWFFTRFFREGEPRRWWVVKWVWMCGGGEGDEGDEDCEGGEIGKGSQEASYNYITFRSPSSTAVLLCMRNIS